MNAASSWNDANGDVSSVAPSSNAVLFFTTNAVVQPVLTSSMTVIGLHFHACTNSTSEAAPRVHPAEGEGGYNYSGYRITGTDAAVLTLDGDDGNNRWTRDVHMATKGTNSIAVSVIFTDNRKHCAYSSGGRFIFEKPVSTHALEIQSGGGLRPGEQGGELNVSGSVSFADGAKIIADVGPGVHGCANFTGSNVSLSAAGGVVVELQPVGVVDCGARVKILDWSAASSSTSTAFDLSRYSVSLDTNVFSRVRLSVKDSAMYLHYSSVKQRSFRVFLK